MPAELTGWAGLRTLLAEATALVDEIEPLAQAGTAKAWQLQDRFQKLAERLEQSARCCRLIKTHGWRVVRDENGKAVSMVWWG